LVFSIFRAFFTLLFYTLYPCRIRGKENIPEAPYIICSNHLSWLDPPLIICIFWQRNQVFFMAKEELFQIPIIGFVIKKTGAFPVKKDIADRKAIQQAVSLLKENKVVGMFPEGTRSKTGKLQKLLDGASWIALRSNVPVVPVAIRGPYRLFKPVNVFIGEPMYFKGDKNGKKYSRKDIRDVSESIGEGINRLLENHNA